MEWRRNTAGQDIAPSQVAAGAKVMRTVAGSVIQLILAVATVCSRSASAADVTFITDFGYYGRHAYFYVALDKGYYKAENLDVNILRGQGSIDTVKKVGSGAALVGFADAGALVLARANDSIPVKLFAIVYKKPPHALFSLAETGIKVPKDLEGKTLADTPFSAIPVIFKEYALVAGIDQSKVKWTRVEGSSLPALLATGRADAVGQFTVGEPLIASVAAPKKVTRLAFKDVGLDYYGNGLVATEQTIREQPGLLKAFARATLKGLRDAFANPAEAGIILNKYQKQIAPDVGQGETELVKELAIVPEQELGVIDPKGIARTIDTFGKAYPLNTNVEPQDMYVPGFVE
jgi:NitT/TauT family transport system substrate-binding protein